MRAMPLTRRCDVACLVGGSVRHFAAIAPVLPSFEEAFCAMARGTLIATEAGSVAIEDLQPGAGVLTADNGVQPVLWIGSVSMVPGAPARASMLHHLTRVTADRFGFACPASDLMLGPAARLLRREFGGDVLSPVAALEDGESVIAVTPPAPVTVYHMAFARHQIIRAGGLAIESYHPGLRADMGAEMGAEMALGAGMSELFLGLFPPFRNFEDFGPLAYPRHATAARLSA